MKKQLNTLLVIALFTILGGSAAFASGEVDSTSPAFSNDPINGVANTVYDKDKGRLTSGNEERLLNPLTVNDAAYYNNANKTGLMPLKKSVNGQKIHGEYKKNTNSCASCHMTHTAVGANLLFRNSTWNTCTSCHDGSLGGSLNVLMPGNEIQTRLDANSNGIVDNEELYTAGGGTFAGVVGDGSSMHMATGALKLNSAPGGNKVGSNIEVTGGSTWGAEFSCSSCHSPHGSYSPRLLHYNPNNVGNELPSMGGYKSVSVDVYHETIGGVTYYFVGGSNTGFDNRNKNPWLYDYKYVSDAPKDYITDIIVNGNVVYDVENQKNWNDVLEINYGGAYFTDPDGIILDPQNVTITMDIAPALVVDITPTLADAEGVRSISDYGDAVSLSRFCAACHTDYIKEGTDSAETGTFSHGYRHGTNESIGTGMVGGRDGKMNCLTCHYSHGTTKEIQLQTDNSFTPESDLNPSSALKRYVNNAICYKCHFTVNYNQ